jgi:hypothetical protein
MIWRDGGLGSLLANLLLRTSLSEVADNISKSKRVEKEKEKERTETRACFTPELKWKLPCLVT